MAEAFHAKLRTPADVSARAHYKGAWIAAVASAPSQRQGRTLTSMKDERPSRRARMVPVWCQEHPGPTEPPPKRSAISVHTPPTTMAKAKLNALLEQLSGTIDNWVIKHTQHGTVRSRRPDMSRVKWSAAQIAQRKRMPTTALSWRTRKSGRITVRWPRKSASRFRRSSWASIASAPPPKNPATGKLPKIDPRPTKSPR